MRILAAALLLALIAVAERPRINTATYVSFKDYAADSRKVSAMMEQGVHERRRALFQNHPKQEEMHLEML